MRTASWRRIVVLSLMIGLCGTTMVHAKSEFKIGVLAYPGDHAAVSECLRIIENTK